MPFLRVEVLKFVNGVSNCVSESVLMNIPRQDLSSSICETDLFTQPMAGSKALRLIWDMEGNQLRVCLKLKLENDFTTVFLRK